MPDCLICDRIQQIKENKNQYFVEELSTGYVVVGDHQRFYGYVLFLCNKHVRELHDLDDDYMMQYLKEMALVSKACSQAFDAEKMNLESLGNGHAHLHFHLFSRRQNDMTTPGPVWWLPKEEMYHEKHRVTEPALSELKNKLKQALKVVFEEVSHENR